MLMPMCVIHHHNRQHHRNNNQPFMHICTFRTFSPLPAHFFFAESFMHFTRRCNKNCSSRTHTQRTINDLQIDDCIIQSASEVYYNVSDTSCLTSTAKIFNKQHTNDHVIHVEIAYILMFFRHFFLNLTVCMCTVQCTCVCVCHLSLSQCERS